MTVADYQAVVGAAHAFLEAADMSSLRAAVETRTAAALGGLAARLILPRTRSAVDDDLASALGIEGSFLADDPPNDDDTRTLLEPFYHFHDVVSDCDPGASGQAVRDLCPNSSALCVGLRAGGNFYGVLAVLDEPGVRQWRPAERAVLQEMGAFAAQALRAEEITRDREARDGLTGLFDQAYLRRELKRELERPQPLTLVMIDVDHFKSINDTAGHAAGDAVLRQISAYLTQYSRAQDIAVRYGGEEFAVLLIGAGESAGVAFAERLRDAVASAAPGQWNEWPGQVTLSAGVAACHAKMLLEAADLAGADNDDMRHAAAIQMAADRLIERADQALYRAKRGGRNRVCRADDVEAE